ncbi:hypothetical protein M2152_001518 [Microbacteriaceae bacterium SG_E_30_P1]|uniref:Uncharacterized protein n=1 Tax=Antiquaquibacter oligotrophicus TaxID=2880260 RepID=A0ABT6KMV5_9MICO|nr:hypothetical protein [Antiquaquibacter oligotrophicus]MDH6181336.1 hypothetical protein [Antiquaquibacter oligotrophicus]UDF12971.1 hypothetical protein LH407_12525 [Antiquaquibacter oligotrophicus]
MILLGYYLAMLGVADATRGLPRGRQRWGALRGLLLALLVGVLGVQLTGIDPLVMLVPFVFTVAWVTSTPGGRASTRWPLLALLVSLAGIAYLSLSVATPGPLDEWLATSAAPVDATRVVLLLGCGLVLLETANIVVRLVLASESSARSDLSEDSSDLKGGRIIGPLERLMVFGLAAAGQFAAIGGVLAAKGVVRFPELSRSVRKRKTGEAPSKDPEYFLIGSLASWGIALLASLLLR